MASSSAQPLLQAHNVALNRNTPHPFVRRLKSIHSRSRRKVKSFLSSSAQHYTVLTLVALDLLGIFADIIINLYQCDILNLPPIWDRVRSGLGIAGLVFSCLFTVELLLSLWVFGFSYLKSKFHILDATVILAGLIIDVLLHGVLEEVASLVVILRLWRFFKIIEEFSVGAEEQMANLEVRIERLEDENRNLVQQLKVRKRDGDEELGEST
ncbi:hypothetical protein B0O99DRAFT_510060 [Bisporella sp. PMI_857]|nr:hypothetical protein B0O99DRAFT_510060 [Bisporella sp. PMI_857]